MSHPNLAERVGHRLLADPAPLIVAAAVLAVGLAMRDRRLTHGGGRMLTLELGRRLAEGVMRGADGEGASGAAAAIPAAAAWAAGMVADRLFGADEVEAK